MQGFMTAPGSHKEQPRPKGFKLFGLPHNAKLGRANIRALEIA